jgi:hypothetical protein
MHEPGFSAPYFLQTDIAAEMTSGLVAQDRNFVKCITWTFYYDYIINYPVYRSSLFECLFYVYPQ